MQTKTYWLLILLLSLSLETFSQKVFYRSNQQWIQYYSQIKISQQWSINADGGFRWKDGHKLQYIARTGINYQINPKLKIGAGMASTGSYQQNSLNRVEFRPYQEIFSLLSDKNIIVTSRFRLEERFFRNKLEIPVTHDFNFRFRYQLSFTIPIIAVSKSDESQKLSLVLSDEIFVNTGHDITYNALDRNRVLIGPSFPLSRHIEISASYLYQFAQRNSPAQYDSDNVFWFTIRHNLDITKSKE